MAAYEKSQIQWDRLIAIPASGIAFASGGAMIGAAAAGPLGALVGGVAAAAAGAAVEIASQRRHEKTDKKQGE